jgi:hypothetical protein
VLDSEVFAFFRVWVSVSLIFLMLLLFLFYSHACIQERRLGQSGSGGEGVREV